MRDDIYQAETLRIAAEQQARLDQARQALQDSQRQRLPSQPACDSPGA